MTVKILIVDDEIQIRRFLNIALTASGYQVSETASAAEGLKHITLTPPDLVLLDLGLPDRPGLAVLQDLRQWSRIPVIILSVHHQEKEKVRALDLGADDYLTKPFGVQELLARIRVALRHAAAPLHNTAVNEQVLGCGELELNRQTRQLQQAGQGIKLTKTEFNLLEVLMLHAGKVLTHRYLLSQVWGAEYQHESHYLQVYISQLRRKLESDPSQPTLILTEPGVGYRLSTD